MVTKPRGWCDAKEEVVKLAAATGNTIKECNDSLTFPDGAALFRPEDLPYANQRLQNRKNQVKWVQNILPSWNPITTLNLQYRSSSVIKKLSTRQIHANLEDIMPSSKKKKSTSKTRKTSKSHSSSPMRPRKVDPPRSRSSGRSRPRETSYESDSSSPSSSSSSLSDIEEGFHRMSTAERPSTRAPTPKQLGYSSNEVVSLEMGTNIDVDNIVSPFINAKDKKHSDETKRTELISGAVVVLGAKGSAMRFPASKGKIIRSVAHPTTGKATSGIELTVSDGKPFLKRNMLQLTDPIHRRAGYVDGGGNPLEEDTPFIDGMMAEFHGVDSESEDEETGDTKKEKFLFVLPPSDQVVKGVRNSCYGNSYFNSNAVTDEQPDALELTPDYVEETITIQLSTGIEKEVSNKKNILIAMIPIDVSKVATKTHKKKSSQAATFAEFYEKQQGKRDCNRRPSPSSESMDASLLSLSLSASSSSASSSKEGNHGDEASNEVVDDASDIVVDEASSDEVETEVSNAQQIMRALPEFAKQTLSTIRGLRDRSHEEGYSRSRSRSRDRFDESSPDGTALAESDEVETSFDGFARTEDEETKDVKGGADHKRAKVLVGDSQADKPMDLDFNNLAEGAQTSLSSAAADIRKGTYVSPAGKQLFRG